MVVRACMHATLVALAVVCVVVGPDLGARPEPAWHQQACARFDVC